MCQEKCKVPSGGGSKVGDYIFCPILSECVEAPDFLNYSVCYNCKEQRNCCRRQFPAFRCDKENPCRLLETNIKECKWVAKAFQKKTDKGL